MKETLNVFKTAIKMTSPGVNISKLNISHMKILGPVLLNVRAWNKLNESGMILDWNSFEILCQSVFGVDHD